MPDSVAVQGFDFTPTNATIPSESWQMVPLGGARRVVLTKGDQLDVALTAFGGGPSAAATFKEVNTPTPAVKRELWISGQRAGSAILNANNGSTGRTETRLQIAVLQSRTITLSFFCVADDGGHTTTTLNCSSIQSIVERANFVWESQANISLRTLHCRPNWKVKADLGDVVDANKSFSFMDPGEFSADLNVFLVWAVENPSSDGVDVLAVTRNDRCIFEENMEAGGTNDSALSLAHEVGHFLGLGHVEASNLMYKTGGSDNLTKQQILQVHEGLSRNLGKRPPISFGPWGF